MTSVLQTYARNPENPTPIDVLVFRTEVRKFHKTDIQDVPKDGKRSLKAEFHLQLFFYRS